MGAPRNTIRITARAILLATMALLSGCAVEPTVAASCAREKVADLPVALGRYLLVPASVNGTELPLAVDTGSERSLLTTATAKDLLLAGDDKHKTTAMGVGGSVTNPDVYATVQLGRAASGRTLARADIPGMNGIVGSDILSFYDVEFDLPARRFRLWNADCGAATPAWDGPRSAIDVNVTGRGRVLVPVTLDAAPAMALLDTGAQVTLVRADFAARLGATQAALANDREVIMRGVDGHPLSVRLHRFAALCVGDEQLSGPVLGVAEAQISGPQMLLGRDFLARRRTWLSYRAQRLLVGVPAGR